MLSSAPEAVRLRGRKAEPDGIDSVIPADRAESSALGSEPAFSHVVVTHGTATEPSRALVDERHTQRCDRRELHPAVPAVKRTWLARWRKLASHEWMVMTGLVTLDVAAWLLIF